MRDNRFSMFCLHMHCLITLIACMYTGLACMHAGDSSQQLQQWPSMVATATSSWAQWAGANPVACIRCSGPNDLLGALEVSYMLRVPCDRRRVCG